MAVITYHDGAWVEGSVPVMNSMAQSFMHGSTVFDGSRAFNRCAPDLDRHCARLIRSAAVMGLIPPIDAEAITRLAIEGIRQFPEDAELYVRPAMFAEDGFLMPVPESTRFIMTIFEAPLPKPTGLGVCLSSYRRPWPDMAPTAAKAACLYPTSSMAMREAKEKGFDNAIMRDGDGHVVELASANLWLVKDGLAQTPAPNGTFLDGITKHRVRDLLAKDGIETRETTLTMDDFLAADEIFTTGNFGKVLPITRIEDRALQPGPVFSRARELYWDFAAGEKV